MSNSSGSLQEEIAKRDDEISKLTKRVSDLESELIKEKKAHTEETDGRRKDKETFEQRITDLEDQIRVL